MVEVGSSLLGILSPEAGDVEERDHVDAPLQKDLNVLQLGLEGLFHGLLDEVVHVLEGMNPETVSHERLLKATVSTLVEHLSLLQLFLLLDRE